MNFLPNLFLLRWDIARSLHIEHYQTPVISWLLMVILLGGSIWGFQSMGRLEDPTFTVKLAKVITLYPGASAR